MSTPTDTNRTNGTTPTPREIDAVLFDLDRTLVEYRRSSQAVLDVAFDRAGVDPFFSAADWRELLSGAGNGEAFGEAQDTEFVEACFAELAMRRGREPDPARAVAREYRGERDHGDVTFRPGAEDALERALDRYDVGLVTNGDVGMQTPKLEALGLTDTFDVTVFASETVPPKPDPTPFETALDGLGVAADRTIHVGDDYAADVEGARDVGIEPVWLSGASRRPEADGNGRSAGPGAADGAELTRADGTIATDSVYTLSDITEFSTLPWF